MAEAVLDASVLLAFIRNEPGAEKAREILPGGFISSVNLSEVVAKLAGEGASRTEIENVLAFLPFTTTPFDMRLAISAGMLRPHTARLGLSLGDRACLSLALERRLPVFTADRAWAELDLDVEVRLIR